MIYNRDESEVAVLGEVQKYKVGIDERNINHIVTILSSNLYSHPMTSFLRETVSNAIDSHIEAKTDEPIIIYRTANDLSIRDYGTGISPERFEEVYIYIGSSTKRDSDEYIGHFGIGKYAALAIADLANITSYYNGNAYYYVMNKDVDQLHIDLLDTLPTKEGNGVDVRVPLKSWDLTSLKCLAFIDNIYVESEVESEQYVISCFNKRKIHTFKNFKTIGIPTVRFVMDDTTEILLGKIPYKVDYSELWDYSDAWHKSWEKCFRYVFPQIEIGQIDITPNREGLLYSERTKEALRKAYDACIDELVEIWNKECTKEYEDITEYMHRITSYVDNRITLPGTDTRIPVSDKLIYSATYKKYKEWDNISNKRKDIIIRTLYNKQIDVLGRLDDDTLYQGKREAQWFSIKKLLEGWLTQNNLKIRKVIALPSKTGFSSQYFKGFVTEKYGDVEILFIRRIPNKYSYNLIKSFITHTYGVTAFSNSKEINFILHLVREVLQYIKDRITITDIISSPEYATYKKNHMVKKTKSPVSTEKICFTITACCTYRPSEKTTCTLSEIIPYVRRKYEKSNIVYSSLDSPFIAAFSSMGYPNLVVLSAAQNKMHLLAKGLPDWVKPIVSLYSPDNRVLQKYAAIKYIHSIPNIDQRFYSRASFPAPIREMIKELGILYTRYCYEGSTATPIIDSVPSEKYDRYIIALFNMTRKWLELGYKLDQNDSLIRDYNGLGYYLMMKAKKYRLDWKFYKEIRETINQINEI